MTFSVDQGWEKLQQFSLDQEDRFKTVIDSVPAGLVIVNQAGTIVLGNSEVEKMFGYMPGELAGASLERLVPERYRARHPEYRQSFMHNPSKRQMGAGRDLAGLCKDGREIPVEIGLNHIVIEGQTYGIASVVDITERKNISSRLELAYEELRQKNLEMEQFVYTVSHDLKAPLVTSASFMEFIREDLQGGRWEDVQDSFERLEKAQRRMQELINDLLQVSRAGRLELQLEKINAVNIVKDVVDGLSERIKEKNLNVIFDSESLIIFGDHKRLYQVFENLFTNALKYACVGANPEVRILIRETESESCIGVKDSGPGIDSAYHKKIFALFQRLDTTEEGTGVGLAIVARVMQLHGGQAWVESSEGHGATFWLSFPKVLVEKGAGHGTRNSQ